MEPLVAQGVPEELSENDTAQVDDSNVISGVHTTTQGKSFDALAQQFRTRAAEWREGMEACRGREYLPDGDRCVSVTAIELFWEHQQIVGGFPDRASELAPERERIIPTLVAEKEEMFSALRFDLATDYGAAWSRYARCANVTDVHHESSSSVTAKCGPDPIERFRCNLTLRDLEIYVEELATSTATPPTKLRTARLAFARAAEQPDPYACEGSNEPEYELAYQMYAALHLEDARLRVAKLRARQVLRYLCPLLIAEIDFDRDRIREAKTCQLHELAQARQWFASAGGITPDAWRAELTPVIDRAERQELFCDAIALAAAAGDEPRRTALMRDHGNACPK